MSMTLIDGIKTVTFHNGVLRIDCIAAGPNNEERPSGTLLIPANQAKQVLQALVNATQELEKRIREQVEQAEAAGKTSKKN
ncbi:MAG: hypothetical protein ACLPX7_03630 [Xanthobacteraceae bacterium]